MKCPASIKVKLALCQTRFSQLVQQHNSLKIVFFPHDTGGWRQMHIFINSLKGLNEILMRGEKYYFTLIAYLQLRERLCSDMTEAGREKQGWLIFTVCTSKSRTRGQIIHSKKKKKKTAEGDGKNGRRDGERAQTGAQGGMSGDKGGSRGIRGSPQSRLPELGWRQLSVEAEKMKHHLGAGPPRCSPSCVQGLWAPLPLKSSTPPLHPAAPGTAPPAIWCLSQHSSALKAVSTLSV